MCMLRHHDSRLDRVSCTHIYFIHRVEARLIRTAGSKLILTFLCKFDDVFHTSQSLSGGVQHRHPDCRCKLFADRIWFFNGKVVHQADQHMECRK